MDVCDHLREDPLLETARPPILFTYNRRNKKKHESNKEETSGIEKNVHESNQENTRGGREESKEIGDQQEGPTVS